MIQNGSPPPRIHVIEYSAERLTERDVEAIDDLRLPETPGTVCWIDVQGLGDETVMRRIAERFSLHPLAMEDVVNVPQRPKVESYDGHDLWIIRMVRMPESRKLVTEQLSMVLGRGFLLTFQEQYGDVLDPVRARLRRGGGPIRSLGADYLAYAIFDAVVDEYYPVLEVIGESLEEIEEEVVANPTPAVLHRIHQSKHLLLTVRRAIWPQRELANAVIRERSGFVSDPVREYLRDCYDHAVQIIDVVETYRELTGSLMDLYLSTVSNRMNEVMKVLTVMASIFIPLTFIAGIYGMNFEYMPELRARWAYPVLWLVMLSVGAGMTAYFWYRGWLGMGGRGSPDRRREPPG